MSDSTNNKMGVVQLTVLTAVNMMGSGIIMLPTKLASVGTMSVLSWIVTAFGSLCLAYGFPNAGCLAVSPGVWGDMQSMLLANPETSWQISPTR